MRTYVSAWLIEYVRSSADNTVHHRELPYDVQRSTRAAQGRVRCTVLDNDNFGLQWKSCQAWYTEGYGTYAYVYTYAQVRTRL
jgi:hypothetical protein